MITSMVVVIKTVSNDIVYPFKSIDLLDQSGASLLGGAAVEHAYLQATQRARNNQWVPSADETDAISNSYFHVPIGEAAAHYDSVGAVGAYIPMSGSHQLRYYFPFTVDTAQTCEIVVLYTATSVMTVEKGLVSVSHS
jgi:hypothetical protein